MRYSLVGALLGLTSFLGVTVYLTSRNRKKSKKHRIAYEDVGVSIKRSDEAVSLLKKSVLKTYNGKVFRGGNAGIYQISENQALAFSIDGVGTKTKFLLDHLERNQALTVMGHDIVNHCVNDILVHNARPITFMDYIATHRIEPNEVSTLVSAMAKACFAVGCVLIGGETAEMPIIYPKGSLDIAGSVTGIIRLDRFIDGLKSVKEGDVVVGLRSSGPHSNGYTLLNRLYRDVDFEEEDNRFLYALTSSHKCYLDEVTRLECSTSGPIHALAHITGGGWKRNIRRVLPEGLRVAFEPFIMPRLFQDIQRRSGMTNKEMFETFNCGVGMMAILDEEDMGIATFQGWKYLGKVVDASRPVSGSEMNI